jgi:ribosomal protein S18 acetylase RimI-like enzyme
MSLVRKLDADDAPAWRALRWQGLQECPTAFAASFDEEKDRSLEDVATMLRQASGAVFGAWTEGALCSIAHVQREPLRKMAHKAHVWGMYTAPNARRAGLAAQVMRSLMAHARDRMGLEFLTLGVNTQCAAALRLYESVGFVREGIERGFLKIDGVLHDEWHMQCDLRTWPG